MFNTTRPLFVFSLVMHDSRSSSHKSRSTATLKIDNLTAGIHHTTTKQVYTYYIYKVCNQSEKVIWLKRKLDK